ncbi:unnamed protein product [Clonostachys rosea f. rosea IK726]|uniref:Uncharacterized protein n=1 Tax=Clonostachys rosea f. rosea IK726 TaxID=1349383 RepID=A0ACA9TAL1_BIOOC|nr:unnamed protein product [Clonostachys rosea f. rosea IK726]
MSKNASNKKPSERYWRGSVGDEISNFTLLLVEDEVESVISLYPLADTGESIFNEFCRDFIVVAHIVGSLQCSGMTASLHGGKLHYGSAPGS